MLLTNFTVFWLIAVTRNYRKLSLKPTFGFLFLTFCSCIVVALIGNFLILTEDKFHSFLQLWWNFCWFAIHCLMTIKGVSMLFTLQHHQSHWRLDNICPSCAVIAAFKMKLYHYSIFSKFCDQFVVKLCSIWPPTELNLN